jgi:chromosome partitioning protein
MMKTIAVSLQKGGVGKTSLAVAIAAELGCQQVDAGGGAVLFIDADPQGNASAWIGQENINAELSDVLYGKASLDQAIMKTETAGLFLLPTAGLGGTLKSFSESQAKDDPFCMRRLIRKASELGYTYSVIDLSPGWGAIERAAILSSDEVLTPVLGDSFALDGLQIFAENLRTLRERMETDKPVYNKIIVNAIDGRIRQHADILKAINDSAHGLKIYEVPVDPAFRMAQKKHIALQAVNTAKTDTKAAIEAITKDIRGV